MILSHWYFCSSIKLSVQETADYLELMFVLERRASARDCLAALEQLEQLDELQRAYAIPILVSQLISTPGRELLKNCSDEDQKDMLIAQILKLLRRSLAQDGQLEPPVMSIVNRLDRIPLDDIPQIVWDQYQPTHLRKKEALNSYLETAKFSMDIFWLSLLKIAGEEYPEVVKELDFTTHLDNSLHHGYGELPWQLAFEIACLGAENFKSIQIFLNESWMRNPACVGQIQKLLLLQKEETLEEGHSAVFPILQESYLLNLFEKNYQRWEKNDSILWVDHKATSDNQKELCAIIWQVSAWETAFAVDWNFCVHLFENWWATPLYGTKGLRAKEFGASNTAQHLLWESNTVFYQEILIPTSVCSPWQRSIPDGMDGLGRFTSFPFMKKSFLVLRSCCAAYLLRGILSEKRAEEYNINYYRLLLNLGDAFRHEDTNQEIRSKGRGPFWSAPLCALALFAQKCIRLTGMGIENPKIPEAVVNALVRSKKTRNDELLRLKTQGYLICAHWAVERLHYGTPRTITEYNPWFNLDDTQNPAVIDGSVGNRCSIAKKLCIRLIDDDMYDRAIKSVDALELLYQKYRYDPDFQYTTEQCWDSCYLENPMQYLEDNNQISLCDILLAGDIPIARWLELSSQESGLRNIYFTPDAWLLALTMRLRAVLQEHTSNDQEETFRRWYQQWQCEIFSVPVKKLQEKRIVMNAVCDMLQPQMLSEDMVNYSALKSSLISDVIDLIYDVTYTDSVYELLNLSKHLSQKQPHFPFNTNMLHAAQEQHMRRLSALSQKYPQFSVFLEKYICSISEYLMMYEGNFLRRNMNIFWHNQCVEFRDVRAKEIIEQEWNPLEDRFLHRKENALVVSRPTVDTSTTWNNGKAINRFKQSVDWENESNTICGIIVSERSNWQTGTKEYTVNCGGPDLIVVNEGKQQSHKRIGDVVHIHHDGMNYKFRKAAWIPGTESEKINISIKELSVQSKMQMIMILPNGENKRFLESSFALSELLDIWAPDISRFVFGPKPLQDPSIKYEAVFSKQLQAYVPAKRSYARLLLEKIFLPENPEHRIKLTYINSEYIAGEHYDLFCAEAGENYLLPLRIWDSDSRERIAEDMVFSRKVQACVCIADGEPLLQLDEVMPYDDINLSLAQLLTEGNTYWTECDENTQTKKSRWIQIDFQGQPLNIACVIDSVKPVNVSEHTNVQLISGGWDRMCQRKMMAKCLKINDYRIRENYRRLDQIAKLVQIKAGDVVRMQKLLSTEARNGYYTVLLSSGILAQCAAESISMLGGLNQQLNVDRLCIVENVYSPSMDQIRLVENVILEGTEEEYQLEGIITVFSPVPDFDENTAVMQEVTFLTKNGILSVNVPMNKFQRSPQNLGALVTAYRQPDGSWSIQATERRISVRALWTIQEHQIQDNEEIIGTVLGKRVRIPGRGYKTVSQDHRAPTLHLWPDDILLHNDPRCGIADGKGTVKAKWRRNCDLTVFHYAKYTDIVQLNLENMCYWGEANRGEFSTAGFAWSVEFSIGVSIAVDGVDYFDVRRLFFREQILEKTSKPRAKEHIQTYIELYNEWLNGSDRHVFGEIVCNQLKLHNMQVPRYTSASSAADQWDDKIPMLPNGAKPWVVPNPEKPYSRTVRAILQLKDDQWYASCRDAQPFRLNAQLVDEFKAVENEKISISLYYAGPEKEGYLRFEWGHGYSFLVRKEDIVDHYGNNISMELFYGDRIREFRLCRVGADVPSEFGWHMVVPTDAILHEISWQIWQDSQRNILQLLRVRVDRNEQSVDIKEVSMVEYSVSRYQKTNKGWSFRAFHNGRFHSESVRKLLEEDAPATREQIVIAKVEMSEEQVKAHGIYFNYISLEDAELNPMLLEGKTLCLTAGYIYPMHRGFLPGNDYCLNFYLPHVLPDTDTENNESDFSVNVIRRSFSLDESKLRVLATEHKDEFYRKNMLVNVFQFKGFHKWNGSILSTPVRHIESLREWVQSKNNCLVILDKPDGDCVTVEVSPGILCKLPVDTFNSQVHKGAIALLKLEKDKICGRMILPGDRNYIPAAGRAVELLPKDDVYRLFLKRMRNEEMSEQNQHDGELTNDSGKFTVASFPQLEVSNQQMLDKMICKLPPRLCWLKPDRFDADKYYISPFMSFSAANLLIDRYHSHPKLRFVYPEEKIVQTEWNKLSFMDAKPEQVAAFACHGKWHYHDKETAVYNQQSKKIIKRSLPSGNNFSEVLLFPTAEEDLRFQFRNKSQNIYSAREIAEYGLPKDDAKYPVAYSDSDSLYVEMMPGRVVELKKHYLFFENGDTSLSEFNCRSLIQGDLIHLRNGISFDNGQRQINVCGFTFGSRHYFGHKLNYLPIIGIEPERAVLLGSEKAPLIYPTSQTDVFVGKTLASLNYRNELNPFKENKNFVTGDTVLITLDQDGYFRLAGYPGSVTIKCAPALKWMNAQWIHELLTSYRGKELLFNAIGGELTVMVDSFVRQGDHAEMSFMIEQDDFDHHNVGTILCVKCLGLASLRGVKYLLACCGRTIMRIPMANILPDMPIRALNAVVSRLVEQNISLWLHREEDGWYCGIAGSPDAEEVEVDLIDCIEEAEGFLCSNTATRELCWLPRSLAARVDDDICCKHIWEALFHRPTRLAQVKKRALISLINTTESEKCFTAIRSANKLCRAIPLVYLKQLENRNFVYLAELYPNGDVVYLNSEDQLIYEYGEKTYGDPIPLQLVYCAWNCVRFVPLGAQRYRQYIPSWINTQLRMNPKRKIDYPVRFKIYNNKVNDAWNGQFSNAHLSTDKNATAANICYLASWIIGSESHTCSTGSDRLAMQCCRDWLQRWLKEEGEMLACGFSRMYLRERNLESRAKKKELDLRPLLAAIILLNRLKCPENPKLELIAKELAVHFTRMVGLSCDQSLHVEIILKEWLMSEDSLPETWKRFNGMSMGGLRHDGTDSAAFDGLITEEQMLVIKRVCNNVEELSTNTPAIKLVARALLHSIGRLEDYRIFGKDLFAREKDYDMGILATYGRILTPGIDSAVAVTKLPNHIIRRVEFVFKRMKTPLSVMTGKIPVSEMSCRYALKLCQQYYSENSKNHGHYIHRDGEELEFDQMQ